MVLVGVNGKRKGSWSWSLLHTSLSIIHITFFIKISKDVIPAVGEAGSLMSELINFSFS